MNEVAGDLCTVQIDEQRQMMVITPMEPEAKQPAGPVTLSYTRVDDQHFKLEGKVGADTLAMQLELLDASSMLLLKRGFHWVNEAPFSR
jgi:hypothetical protein